MYHSVRFQVEYDDVETAKQAVRNSRAYAVLQFRANYSQNMMLRLKDQTAAPPKAIEGSDILAWLDMSGISCKSAVFIDSIVVK